MSNVTKIRITFDCPHRSYAFWFNRLHFLRTSFYFVSFTCFPPSTALWSLETSSPFRTVQSSPAKGRNRSSSLSSAPPPALRPRMWVLFYLYSRFLVWLSHFSALSLPSLTTRESEGYAFFVWPSPSLLLRSEEEGWSISLSLYQISPEYTLFGIMMSLTLRGLLRFLLKERHDGPSESKTNTYFGAKSAGKYVPKCDWLSSFLTVSKRSERRETRQIVESHFPSHPLPAPSDRVIRRVGTFAWSVNKIALKITQSWRYFLPSR